MSLFLDPSLTIEHQTPQPLYLHVTIKNTYKMTTTQKFMTRADFMHAKAGRLLNWCLRRVHRNPFEAFDMWNLKTS